MNNNSTTTRVSVVSCESYDREKIVAAVEQTFSHFGGVRSIVKKGATVLLKPNWLKKSRPEECIITHPTLIEVVAEMVQDAGAKVIIGDSPAFGAVADIAKRVRLDLFAKKRGIEIVELDAPRKIKAHCGTKRFKLTVSGKALDVDAIINLPKLKVHAQMLYTAAVKNMYGCVSGKIKAWRHFKSNNNLDWYTEMLLANYQAVKPVFTLVDAVMSMEKRGPTGGVPKQTALILGGVDCIAIDRIIAEIINVHPSHVPILRTAKAHGIGEQDIDRIEIAGNPLSSVRVHDFVLPDMSPIGFSAKQVVKSLVKHLWLKSFGKASMLLLAASFLFPLCAFSESDRLKSFPAQITVDDIIHVPTGNKVSFPNLSAFFDSPGILYVGETHANNASHQVQLKVLKACYEKFQGNIAIGMEMFTRPYQPFLDLWIAGEIDENKFLEDTKWDSEWGYDYTLYKDILDFAREKKIPIVALNAPRTVVKMVSKKGLKDLTEEEKKLVPEMDTSDFFHRVYMEKIVGKHLEQGANLDRYNEVQSLWEEYMAQSITDYMTSWEGKGKKMLVFAGNGHIIYDFGIPKRVFRRNPFPYYTIYPAEFQEGKPTLTNQDIFMAEVPLEPADFVWVISPVIEQKRIYLGVQLPKTGDKKLAIQTITPGSPAEKAGILPGDVIVSIDGKNLKSVMELVHYLQTKRFGETCNVAVDRGGAPFSFAVELFEMPQE